MDSIVKFEGSVEKSSGIFKNRTTIWMVLEGLTLTYYKDHKKSFCVGSVDVTEIQTARKTGKKQGREFEVTTKSTGYTFTVETDELAEAWVHVIQQSMLQKSSIRNAPDNTMSSSDYAQIGDVTPARGGSGRSKIYEEISEIQSSAERNIFGVRLRPSFHRAHPPPTQSQAEIEVPKPSPSVSSFKPVPSSPAIKQIANETITKPEEPLYAKPNKPAVKPNTSAQTTHGKAKASITANPTTAKKFNKPPPSFAPPPPPSNSAKRENISAKEANNSEYAQPLCDRHAATKNDNKGKDTILESDYAQIAEEDLKNLKTGKDAIEPKEESDDEHTYYLADSISRNIQENTEDKASTNEEKKKPVIQSSDDTITQTTCSNSELGVAKETTACSEGSYEEIDVSQVVRRKRGSHVTLSFADDTPAPNDSTDGTVVSSRDAASATDRRTEFRNTVEDKSVEETYENHEVFAETTGKDDGSKQEGYDNSKYGTALDSVIGTMVNSMKDTDIFTESNDNGEAFASLKEYLERNSHGGFDLESHRISSRNSVEKLQSLLQP